ncbi:hypothetical protein POTOM_017918 [Populus tomentosa]|uniref:Chromo domain-containing protein n=1 Tax=Populus tomentosa TaxID=118781 RepID=A0A8X7ZVP6_POPTO|nr:hypothetical protein POTOM_017918 [Populus tomentosa]
MTLTRSGKSYTMSDNHAISNPSHEHGEFQQPNYQQQLTQITYMLEQLSKCIDVMDERRAREGIRSPNRRGRDQPREDSLEGDQRIEREHIETETFRDLEPRHPRVQQYREDFPRIRDRRIMDNQPIDELTKRIKIDVPDFYGKLDPHAFEDWLTAIEDYFDWFVVAENRKTRYVRLKLKGHARAWWGSVEEQLRRTQRPAISDWEEMKERLKEKYLPIDYEQMMFEEMLQLRQGSSTVDQYTDRFHELTTRSRIVETDQQTLARYRNGLRGDLYKEMLIARLINVNEAYQLALRLEKQLQSMSGKRPMLMDLNTGRTSNFPMQKPQTPVDKPRSSWSREQTGRTRAATEGPQCYKCKGFGHYAVVCPTRDKKMAFIYERELTIMNETEEDETAELTQEEEEEQLGASELPSSQATDLAAVTDQYPTDEDFGNTWEKLQARITVDGDLQPLPSPPRPSAAGLDFSEYMKDVHTEVRRRLSLSTESYAASANARRKDRQFNNGDMVLVRLKPERFPSGSFTKLNARRAGPFHVIKKLGSNAYVIDLPSDFGISPIFNIEDITAFKGDATEVGGSSQTEDMPASIPRIPAATAPKDEIAAITDHQFVSTRRGGYYKFLVHWKHRSTSDSTWIKSTALQQLHPELFTAYVNHNLPESSSSREPANDAIREAEEEEA